MTPDEPPPPAGYERRVRRRFVLRGKRPEDFERRYKWLYRFFLTTMIFVFPERVIQLAAALKDLDLGPLLRILGVG